MGDYGHGGIYQRKGDGLWIATAELPSNRARGDAPRRRKTFGSKTREGAIAKREAYRAANPAAGESRDSAGHRAGNLARGRTLGAHTNDEWHALVKACGGMCAYCGVKTDLFFKAPDGSVTTKSPKRRCKDHRTPLAAGGSDSIQNIACVCYQCNSLKGVMDEPAFRAWLAARA